MKFLKTAIATAALLAGALGAVPAQAVLTFGTIPGSAGSNDFLNLFFPGKTVEGFYGAQLFSTGGTITAQYFGAEAGFINQFRLTGSGGSCNPVVTFQNPIGNTFQNHGAATLGPEDTVPSNTSCTSTQAAGLINFGFLLNSLIPLLNGANPDNSLPGGNFFVTFDNPAYVLDTNNNGSTPSSGQSVFIFLDDGGGGGAQGDDNHDDMVIRLSIDGGQFHIPEPGSLALAGLALLALGASRRKKS